MSTFEALKLAYLRSTGKDEPGVLALLAFGSVSGSVGATSVYPLNLVRTRLQASGSSGHPERYTGMFDVVKKTYARDGWRGFYRGLLPTLAKVGYRVRLAYQMHSDGGSTRWCLQCLYRMSCMSRARESECFKGAHLLAVLVSHVVHPQVGRIVAFIFCFRATTRTSP